MARLERGDRARGRRLGEVQRMRGLGHMEPLGDGDENAKLLQGQCRPSGV